MNKSGDIYIADRDGAVVLKYDNQTQLVSILAGNYKRGRTGDGGSATAAMFERPFGLAVDSQSNLYISDELNGVVRKVEAMSGKIIPFAGSITLSDSSDELLQKQTGKPLNIIIFPVNGIAIDAHDNIYMCTTGNLVCKVDRQTGLLSLIAGNGKTDNGQAGAFSGDEGLAINASFNKPIDIACDTQGNLYIADYANNRIRKIDAASDIITTIAGNGRGL